MKVYVPENTFIQTHAFINVICTKRETVTLAEYKGFPGSHLLRPFAIFQSNKTVGIVHL